MVITHDITFPDEATAARFVWRVHKNLQDVATLRSGRAVRILDASARHAARIAELARESSGTFAP